MIDPRGRRAGRRHLPIRTACVVVIVLATAGAGLLLGGPAQARSYPDVVGKTTLSHAQVQAKQWWLTRLSLRKAWTISRGKGVTVAVMDTGVDRKFGDLQGALVPGLAVDTKAVGDTDETYHGTRMADDIAGRGTGFGLLGVAPQAKILPVTVPSAAPNDAVSAALNNLRGMSDPPQIVNMSFGGPLPCPASVASATRAAARAGMMLFAAAGNSAQTGNLSQFPANCPGVVGVGAVNSAGGSYSMSQRRSYVMLAGPGVHIIGYDANVASGAGYGTGTSDASAIVSGIAALVRSHFPSMSSRDVVTRLLATTHQFSGKQGTRNDRYGYGVALPYAALTDHVPANFANPVYAGLGTGGPTSPSGTTGSSSATSSAPSSGAASGSSTRAPASTPAAASGSSGGSSSGLLVAVIIVIVLVIVAIVVAVTLRARRRAIGRAGYGPPSGGSGGGYGPPSSGRP